MTPSGDGASFTVDCGERAANMPFAADVAFPLVDHGANLDSLDVAISAASPHPRWQGNAASILGLVFLLSIVAALSGHGALFAALLVVPFTLAVILRVLALWQLVWPPRLVSAPYEPVADEALPFYSVLVPLYRERDVAPALVEALKALDYPEDRIEILFLTELSDAETRLSLIDAKPAKHMRIISVPHGYPQTKPRVLNYALRIARGSLVTVFDAEDVPEPCQLRKAAQAFAKAGPEVVCLQARLGVYNPQTGFLTRQFAIEYASLFEALLPMLQRLSLPILLGGTSNHFRRDALLQLGAWDAYNVTEDADLGARIARSGKFVEMLDSDTWEEAPATMASWHGQRTRWLKGWMQTYLVQMREPVDLWRRLGPQRFFGFQLLLGGMLLSALVHPWFYVLALSQWWLGQPVFAAPTVLMALCWFNLVTGYLVGIALGAAAAWRSEGRVPILSAALVPVYWLAISTASYRALLELIRHPYHWQKTPHSARPVTGSSSPT
jgi:glycosyltransferase XagB